MSESGDLADRQVRIRRPTITGALPADFRQSKQRTAEFLSTLE